MGAATRWQIPEALTVGWQMRALGTAGITAGYLEGGRFPQHVEHAPLPGVTPAMCLWYLERAGRPLTWRRHTALAYRFWHPRDHIFFQAGARSALVTAGISSRPSGPTAASCSTRSSTSPGSTKPPRQADCLRLSRWHAECLLHCEVDAIDYRAHPADMLGSPRAADHPGIHVTSHRGQVIRLSAPGAPGWPQFQHRPGSTACWLPFICLCRLPHSCSYRPVPQGRLLTVQTGPGSARHACSP